MTITDFNYESSYLPSLTCNMDVKSSYWQINFPPVEASSGQEWQIQISNVTDYIGRSTGRSPPVEASSGQEWQFQISIVTAHISRSTGRSNPHPQVEPSSGQEWQFEIAIVKAHISRSTCRSIVQWYFIW